jgi:hypothetical protein
MKRRVLCNRLRWKSESGSTATNCCRNANASLQYALRDAISTLSEAANFSNETAKSSSTHNDALLSSAFFLHNLIP